jgi:hypothetical protein
MNNRLIGGHSSETLSHPIDINNILCVPYAHVQTVITLQHIL